MASILSGYEYDIFISYRQNDNKYDGWVTEFVDNLQKELDATLKNPVSIYFDENPHDGLQDTHLVDESLKEKLKCVIFIPILSQTYCDESSFAWQHEFLHFISLAGNDKLGMNIRLSNGNVASRILPVRIHDLDPEDQQAFEKATGSPLRTIDFIYTEAGVNRSLRPSDDKNDNLNKTSYRNQMNKVAQALKDLGTSILRQDEGTNSKAITNESQRKTPKNITFKKAIIIGLVAVFILLLGNWLFTKYFSSDHEKKVVLSLEDRTVAVLPFSNTKPNPDTDFLGFAIANQIIGDLAYNQGIIVRPASSIRKYNKQIFDANAVADDLEVNYVLTGAYLIQSGIIRLDIELLEAKSQNLVWRDKIEVDYNNAFELQDIVASKVVNGLQTKFSQTELNRIIKNVPQNALAYEYYLRSLSYPLTNEGDELAINMLNQSIVLDSNFAPSYSHLGFRKQLLAQFSLQGPTLDLEAENAYMKALSLNSNLLSAQANLTTLFVETGRIDKAILLSRQMIDINPNNADAHFALSYVYRYGGILGRAVEEAEKAINLNPNNPRYRKLGLAYLMHGDFKKASEILDLDKGSPYSLGFQADMLLRMGRNKEAKEIYKQIISMPKANMWVRVAKFHYAVMNNNIELSQKLLAELESANLSDGEAWYFWASKYAIINDREGAVRCLKRAIDHGYYNYPFMQSDFFMQPLLGDPEIQELMGKAKAKHENFKEKYL